MLIAPDSTRAARLKATSGTEGWLSQAAENPVARHPSRLPETLDFRRHAEVFLHTYHAVPAGTELGFPIVLREGGLHFPPALTLQPRYDPFLAGGQFLGTFHVHPAQGGAAPFFDPQDLANALRSDNPGFLYLLLARDRLYALVRANPYLYISAHHVNRNPLLLREAHAALVRRRGSREPGDPHYAEHYRLAGLYYFHRYQLALYEGDPRELLKKTLTPTGSW